MRKRISSIVLTVVMILGCFITDMDVNINTVNADPYNIEISVETKEISLEEIPKNRFVDVEVYVNNVPNEDFLFFNVAFKLDQKLENWMDFTFGVKPISSLSVVAGTENKFLILESETGGHSNKKIGNGRIFNIELFLPPEASEGDFYEITPVPDCCNGLDYTSFVLLSNPDVLYGPSNFSFVNSGGIKIRSSQPEQPAPSDPTPTENTIDSNQLNSDPITQPQIVTETIASTEETTYLTSSASTNLVTSSPKTTTASVTSTDYNVSESSTEITTTNKEDNYTIILILLFIIFFLLIIIAFIIKKRKNK